jgi:3-phosphoshikimate 1-carboxyvinyltransferase
MTIICRASSELSGRVSAMPSKSSLHRLLLCSALASGESRITPASGADDIVAALNVLGLLGAKVSRDADGFTVKSAGPRSVSGSADVIESGTTLRLALPVILAFGGEALIRGREGLARRPMGPYDEAFAGKGVSLERSGGASLPLRVSGKLESGEYRLRGDISSQFVSGLLLALPVLEGDSRLVLLTPLESSGYVGLTLSAMAECGVRAQRAETNPDFPCGGWIIPGGQKYAAGARRAESDWSNAAFWIAAKALGAGIEVDGLDPASVQPDRRIVEIVRESPSEVDVSECPDLLPILSVWAGLSGHGVSIRGAGRVRLKECDRVAAMASELRKIGGRIEELKDGLRIDPVEGYLGGRVSGWNDHRVVMALAVASIASKGDVVIDGADAVKKTYPAFWEDFRSLGGKADVE